MAPNDNDSKERRGDHAAAGRARRAFLVAFPVGVFAAVAGVLSAAAFRFLRPRAAAATDTGEPRWSAVAPAASLAWAEPAARKVSITRDAGWASATEERT